MSIKRPAILFLISVILGIITAYNDIVVLDKVLLISITIFFMASLIKTKPNKKILFLMLCFFIFGFMRLKFAEDHFNRIDFNIEAMNNKQQTITAKVVSIGKSTNSNYYILENTKIYDREFYKSRCYFTDKINPNAKIGNIVKITGTIRKNEAPMNFGEFNSLIYYRSMHEGSTIFAKNIEITNSNYDFVKQKIYEAKLIVKDQIYKIFNKKNAGLFTAMVTGDKSGLDLAQKKLFQDNGIAHILAISGLHLSILGLAFFELLRKKFSVKTSGIVVSIFILLYGIFIDASVTTLRAIIMLYIKFLSYGLGRTYDSKNSLFIVGLAFIIYSPYLIFNAGFQFSYIAIFALNTSFWYHNRLFGKIRFLINSKTGLWKVRDNKTLFRAPAVIILTLFLYPITIYHYFNYPLYTIFLNLLVIPLMTLVLIIGLLGLILSFFNVLIGRFFVGIVHYIFILYEKVCTFIETLPMHKIKTGKANFTIIIILFITIYIFHYLMDKKYKKELELNKIFKKKKKIEDETFEKIKTIKNNIKKYNFGLIINAIFVIIITIVLSINIKSKMMATSLYIGQGDSMIVQNENYVMAIDGGSSSNLSAGQYILTPHLKARAIDNIDVAFISHADSDHVNAIIYLLNEEVDINIKKMYLPIFAKDNKKYDELKNSAINRNVEIEYLKAGDVLLLNGNKIECFVINPIEKDSMQKDDINEQSLSFRLKFYEYKNRTMLFTGDMGSESEEKIIKNSSLKKQLESDVLKVGHHGSRYSTSTNFLKEVKPQYAIISYGNNNTYGHPHSDVIYRLEENNVIYYKTGEGGEIDIDFSKENIYFKMFNKK